MKPANGFLRLMGLFRASTMDKDNGPEGKTPWHKKTTKGGNEIYKALLKEMEGPIGKRAISLLLESCSRSCLTASLPQDAILQIFAEHLKGKRPAGIAETIQPLLNVSREDINAICQVVASKASTAMTQARAQGSGANWYCWRTCEDQRVRDSHKHMDKVLVRWDKPPDPEAIIGEPPAGTYHAGECDGCRCYPEPVVSLGFLKPPLKVHIDGKVVKMTKTKFKELL